MWDSPQKKTNKLSPQFINDNRPQPLSTAKEVESPLPAKYGAQQPLPNQQQFREIDGNQQ
jgi:hypothetical protein